MSTVELDVAIPKEILSAARSRPRPSDTSRAGEVVRQAFNTLTANESIRSHRHARDLIPLIRRLARTEGPLSTAIHTMVEVAATKYSILAYDSRTQTLSPEGTLAAMSIVAGMDTPTDYTGVTHKKSVDSTQNPFAGGSPDGHGGR